MIEQVLSLTEVEISKISLTFLPGYNDDDSKREVTVDSAVVHFCHFVRLARNSILHQVPIVCICSKDVTQALSCCS